MSVSWAAWLEGKGFIVLVICQIELFYRHYIHVFYLQLKTVA